MLPTHPLFDKLSRKHYHEFKMSTRIEKDSLGSKEVPADAYWGIQTQRAIENFPISGFREFPEFIEATLYIKRAAAKVNTELGELDKKKARAILQAAEEMLQGKLRGQVVVDAYQAGAGTSFHMNVNEVLANRAIEILGGKRGDYKVVSPNDDVNCAQSTNDVIPTAIRLAGLVATGRLQPVLKDLAAAFSRKAKEFDPIVKSGRTHLQDAVPVRLGQEFAAYATIVASHRKQIARAVDELRPLGIGGTAAGTGLNAHPHYRSKMVQELSRAMQLKLSSAPDLFAAMQSMAPFMGLSGALRNLAQDLIKIANDFRLLHSGPRTGLREIELPAVQPGSSIMPGKVNPVIPEMLNMVCFQVIGNDQTILLAAQAGQLELNVMMPVIAFDLLWSLTILRNALSVFTEKCVKGIQANSNRCLHFAERSSALVTALNPHIGYLKAAEVAKEVLSSHKSIREIVLGKKWMTEKELDEVLDLEAMTRVSSK